MSASRDGNLPVDTTSFVGRRAAIAAVKRLLSESRLVTLSGPGGVGKTRLALRVARELRRAFPDGVWLVHLADVTDPGLVLPMIASELGIQDYSAQGLMSTLKGFLSCRRVLLLLDNCEHVVEPAAEFVAAVLPSAPQVRVLATSRQSLGVTGEQCWVVPPLSVPENAGDSSTRVSTRALAQSEAVALFADRGRGVRSDFVVTPDNGRAVVEICRRLDGIPLAIELAAVRLRALSAEEILRRLNDRFRLLEVGRRGGETRHRTLRAMIDWSYDHCTEAERALWERTAVFSGGFDLAAAEQVCAREGIADEDVLSIVDALVDKSILSIAPGAPVPAQTEREYHVGRPADADVIRYRMLETIREYGRDRLIASGRWLPIRRRHRDHYQQLAATAREQMFGPDQLAWFGRLRREHANLQIAMQFCLTEPGQAQHGMTIATDLFIFLVKGHVSEGRRWYDRALDVAPEPTSARAGVLWANAWMASHQGDAITAAEMLEECRTLAEKLGDRFSLAQVSITSGWIALQNGDPDLAVTLLEKALTDHVVVGDRLWTAIDQELLALMIFMAGDADRAIALFEECLAICREQGELWVRSWALLELTYVMWRQGDYRHAESLIRECLRAKIQVGDFLGFGHGLERLAWLTESKDPQRTARLLGAAARTLESIGATVFTYLRADHERCVAGTRAALGDKAFTELFEQGKVLTIEEAFVEATNPGQKEPPATPPARQDHQPTPSLTRREREVAALVAEGLSNKEIADRLVISKRTAENHVENILTKLGYTSRTQIAAHMPGSIHRR